MEGQGQSETHSAMATTPPSSPPRPSTTTSATTTSAQTTATTAIPTLASSLVLYQDEQSSNLFQQLREMEEKIYHDIGTITWRVPPVKFNIQKIKENRTKKSNLDGYREYDLPNLPRSDQSTNKAENLVCSALESLSDDLVGMGQRAMFIINNFHYDNYLNKLELPKPTNQTAPSGDSTTSEQTGKGDAENKERSDSAPKLPRDVGNRGELDVLVLHEEAGLVLVQVKSVGYNFDKFKSEELSSPEHYIPSYITVAIGKAIKQVERDHLVMMHIMQDLGLRDQQITHLIALPNIDRKIFMQTLELCHNLKKDVDDANLSPELNFLFVEHFTQGDKSVCGGHTDVVSRDPRDSLQTWWRDRLVPQAHGIQLEMMKEIAYRTVGLLSTVSVWSFAQPRVEVRNLNDAAWETSKRVTQVVLTPRQAELLKREDDFLYIWGPAGSGKTLLLSLKGRQWLAKQQEVVILNTRLGSPGRTVGEVMEHTINNSKGLKQKVKRVNIDLKEDVDSMWAKLAEIPRDAPVNFLMDEITWMFETEKLLNLLKRSFPGLTIWCAGIVPECKPEGFESFNMETVLRCPPSVQRVLRLVDNRRDRCELYHLESERHGLATDGPIPYFIIHADHGPASVQPYDCAICGKQLADFLLNKLNVKVKSGQQEIFGPVVPPGVGAGAAAQVGGLAQDVMGVSTGDQTRRCPPQTEEAEVQEQEMESPRQELQPLPDLNGSQQDTPSTDADVTAAASMPGLITSVKDQGADKLSSDSGCCSAAEPEGDHDPHVPTLTGSSLHRCSRSSGSFSNSSSSGYGTTSPTTPSNGASTSQPPALPNQNREQTQQDTPSPFQDIPTCQTTSPCRTLICQTATSCHMTPNSQTVPSCPTGSSTQTVPPCKKSENKTKRKKNKKAKKNVIASITNPSGVSKSARLDKSGQLMNSGGNLPGKAVLTAGSRLLYNDVVLPVTMPVTWHYFTKRNYWGICKGSLERNMLFMGSGAMCQELFDNGVPVKVEGAMRIDTASAEKDGRFIMCPLGAAHGLEYKVVVACPGARDLPKTTLINEGLLDGKREPQVWMKRTEYADGLVAQQLQCPCTEAKNQSRPEGNPSEQTDTDGTQGSSGTCKIVSGKTVTSDWSVYTADNVDKVRISTYIEDEFITSKDGQEVPIDGLYVPCDPETVDAEESVCQTSSSPEISRVTNEDSILPQNQTNSAEPFVSATNEGEVGPTLQEIKSVLCGCCYTDMCVCKFFKENELRAVYRLNTWSKAYILMCASRCTSQLVLVLP